MASGFAVKDLIRFVPLGPFLVTPDEIPDIDNLCVWQKHNGETLQDGNTAEMMFNIPFLIEYISQGMTLLPGGYYLDRYTQWYWFGTGAQGAFKYRGCR